MGRAYIRYQRPVGPGNSITEPRQFAYPLRPHLQYGIAVLFFQAQQGQRIAYFVVVGCERFERQRFAAQHRCGGFFGAGLAIAAGDAKKDSVALSRRAYSSGSVKRVYHVWHDNLQEIRGNVNSRFYTERRARAHTRHIWNKAMSIDALALDGDKKITFPDPAAIVLRKRKHLRDIGRSLTAQAYLPIIALKYICEGEHTSLSSLIALSKLYHMAGFRHGDRRCAWRPQVCMATAGVHGDRE